MSGARPALFDPARHDPLVSEAWNEAAARAWIEAWARDAQGAVSGETTWDWHPLDEDDASTPPHRSLYLGASGVLWALHYFEREGAIELRIKPARLIGGIYDAYLHRPDTGDVRPSYYLGEVGILLVAWRLKGSDEAADRLHAAIERNIPNPVNEALWAAPGTAVGAPGIITGLADFPAASSPEVDALFERAGNLVWRAGPLRKGYGICHGTAGNGYAFLKLYCRTGNPLWLERARAFAMHAIGQAGRMRQRHGRGRHSLWTGDPGLAAYLWHCIHGMGTVPSLDIL